MADSKRCRSKCPCGGQCCCDGSVEHSLHICSAASCSCHSAARYAGTLPVLDVGDVDPLGMGWRAARVLAAEQPQEVAA